MSRFLKSLFFIILIAGGFALGFYLTHPDSEFVSNMEKQPIIMPADESAKHLDDARFALIESKIKHLSEKTDSLNDRVETLESTTKPAQQKAIARLVLLFDLRLRITNGQSFADLLDLMDPAVRNNFAFLDDYSESGIPTMDQLRISFDGLIRPAIIADNSANNETRAISSFERWANNWVSVRKNIVDEKNPESVSSMLTAANIYLKSNQPKLALQQLNLVSEKSAAAGNIINPFVEKLTIVLMAYDTLDSELNSIFSTMNSGK